MRRLRVGFIVLLGLAMAPLGAAQQQAPPKAEEKTKPAKKVRKVWTEDDLASIRKRADEYADQQTAEQGSKAAAAKDTGPGQKPAGEQQPQPKEAPKGVFAPTSLEQVEKWIAFKVEEVRYQAEYVNELRNQYFEASGEEREKLAANVEEQTKILEQGRAELSELEGHRERLQSKPPAKGAPPQTSPTQPSE